GELSHAVKRTVEGAFERVRVRGEISGFKRHSSGHLYFALKDTEAVLDGVCWRGLAGRLAVKPEDGLEVICTGRLTTYPGRSKYQIVVDQMELAGQGALLKLLEERRRKLAAEGLFDAARKKKLPFLPDVIGVVTSPTGAVIRDILHRLADRFPRHVLVWPVAVQGEGAAEQIAAAIEGFNRLDDDGAVPRPDVLIVARGGGSLEDLWAFNEEIVVRAAAASRIPLISAVGHETDTTLIDFAADLRAPTPTAAAELAVPVRGDLVAQIMDRGARLVAGWARLVEERRLRVQGLGRGLGDPRRPIELAVQRLDDRSERLAMAGAAGLERRALRVAHAAARLIHPRRQIVEKANLLAGETRALATAFDGFLIKKQHRHEQAAQRLRAEPIAQEAGRQRRRLDDLGQRLSAAGHRLMAPPADRLRNLAQLLDSFSYERVLERGFALVRTRAGAPITAAAAVEPGAGLNIAFHDGTVHATAEGTTARKPARPVPSGGGQGSLL
ncbi:MAG: exodeoxyribonuclease VII large subunit, partial [Alphaproteobacteria bacterium]|nr:exodeoxyribonuclease VII large subunit [Alphaproteobacteria bacterium]